MKVKDLIQYLSRVNPEADIIIHRDIQTYGFGYLEKIQVGMFTETDYGGDFYLDQRLVVNPKEVQAVCFVAEENEEEIASDKKDKVHG